MRGLLLSLIVLVTLPMALVRPIIGLWLWIGFSYMNPHRLTYGFAYSFPWVELVAVVTLAGLIMNPKQRQAIPWRPVSVLLIVFLAWTAITSTTAVMQAAAWQQWMILAKIEIMAFVTLMLVIDKKRFQFVIWGIVLSFGFWAFKGGVFTILSGGSYHVYGPPGSFFRNNNDFALVMCMTLPLMRYLQLTSSNKWVIRGLWVLMLLAVVSVFGTYSRGGFLALGAMTTMLILKSRHRIPLIVIGLIAAGAIVAFMPHKYVARMETINNYQHNASAMGRIQSWKFATNVALARPILGGGFDIWRSDSMWNEYGPPGAVHRAIHSIFFDVLGSHGFIGLALYLGLIIGAWRSLNKSKKLARAGPEEGLWMHDLANMMQVSLVGFIVAGAFLTMTYFQLFYQLLAMVVLLRVFAERAARTAETDPEARTHGSGPRRGASAAKKLVTSRRKHRNRTDTLPWW